jgi:DNA-binding response OmpR family regulator
MERSAGRLEGTAVLVVDDAPYLREALVLLLESEGARVVATGSGREALDLVHRQPFDLVLTDLRLPDLAGEVLLRDVRVMDHGPAVVVVTGADEEASRVRTSGAARVFGKPIEWSRLLDELVALLSATAHRGDRR